MKIGEIHNYIIITSVTSNYSSICVRFGIINLKIMLSIIRWFVEKWE
jgi:hypothetical protein